MHGPASGVQGRGAEPDRIDVATPLSPIVARQLARRRAGRPGHLPPGAAAGAGGRLLAGTGKVAAVAVVVLIAALLAAVVALWPRGSGGGDELVATGVTTTEARFPGSIDDTATTDRGDRSSTTGAGGDAGAPGTTGSTPSTGGTSTTAEPGAEGAGGPGTTGTSAEAGSGAGSGGGSTSTTGETTTSSAPPTSGASAPSTSAATTTSTTGAAAVPHRGDPDVAATWYELAECETGGNWSARSDGDRSGGLRIREEDWRDHGGEGLPSEHSPDVQITIARRIQADEGWDYWRRCARRLGYA